MIDVLKGMWNSQWMQDRGNAGLLANILGLILILTLVGYGSAISLEYFPNDWSQHVGFTLPEDTYANNAALMADVEAEASATWSGLNDTQKVWELTKFVRRHSVKSASDVTRDWSGMSTATLYQNFSSLGNREYGYMCLGHAALLMHLCDLYGYEAYAICAGDVPGGWTHATTLVRVNMSGHYKMLHCDGYFGDMYVYDNLTPMSFFAMQDFIDASNYTAIWKRSIGYKYDMAAVTNTSYDYNDNPGDGETNMVHTFVKDTGYSTRVWRANSWFLDSYCIETEDAWSLIYTNPYDLWATGEVYDAYDTAHVDKGIAYVEGRET